MSRSVEMGGCTEMHIEGTLGHRGVGGCGCVWMCGVEVSGGVYGWRWLVDGWWYVEWRCGGCGCVWCVEVCEQGQRYVEECVILCREDGGMCER